MKTVNIVIVLTDARTVTTREDGWDKAIARAVQISDDGFYTRTAGVHAVYFCEEGGDIERHAIQDLRSELIRRAK